MKALVFCLAAVLASQPVAAASLSESRLSGVVVGEAMCSLARQGAPKEVLREEFARLTKKLTDSDVVDLVTHGQAFLDVVEGVMQICPERGLPDA